MGYVEQNLISGETITHKTRLHWIMMVLPAGISAFFFLLALFLFTTAIAKRSTGDGGTLAIFGIVVFVFGDLPIVISFLQRASSEFGVTNKRVILKSGVIQRKTAEMFLEKIESVSVDQSLVGRMFNYGTITVHGTGGTAETFDRIAHPLEFRRQVQEQIAASSTRSAFTAVGR